MLAKRFNFNFTGIKNRSTLFITIKDTNIIRLISYRSSKIKFQIRIHLPITSINQNTKVSTNRDWISIIIVKNRWTKFDPTMDSSNSIQHKVNDIKTKSKKNILITKHYKIILLLYLVGPNSFIHRKCSKTVAADTNLNHLIVSMWGSPSCRFSQKERGEETHFSKESSIQKSIEKSKKPKSLINALEEKSNHPSQWDIKIIKIIKTKENSVDGTQVRVSCSNTSLQYLVYLLLQKMVSLSGMSNW